MQEFTSAHSSPCQDSQGFIEVCSEQLRGVCLLDRWLGFTNKKKKAATFPDLGRPSPSNTKQKGEKLDLLPNCFFCHSEDLLFIVCDTEFLCSLRRLWRRFFGAAGGHVTLLNEWTGLSDTLGYMRPAEDRDLTLFLLSPGDCVSYTHFKRMRAGSRLIELVSIARERNVHCNWSRVLGSHAPRHAVTSLLILEIG